MTMCLYFFVIPFFCSALFTGTAGEKESNADVVKFVEKYGYPLEVHHVVTEDGYVLALHRIPHGLRNSSDNVRNSSVVLVMHGLLGCAEDWILSGPNRSLAFMLADDGYDVWLGNSRGTTYSKNHTVLSTKKPKFWNFSWHEMGLYDLPAMIDYILEETGQEELFYVGFSQGTTQFWVSMSLRPEYNKKIKLMCAMAPVAYIGNAEGLAKDLSSICLLTKNFCEVFGYFEVLPHSKALSTLFRSVCKRKTITEPVCEAVIDKTGGFSLDIDYSHLTRIFQFVPAGCSYKQLVHYSMGIQNPGHFRPYDYGKRKNRKIYKASVPPEYPLQKITTPVVLYNGLNDLLAHPKDVELLRKKLPNVVEMYTVELEKLNHFDFVFGTNIRSLVYEPLVQRMNSVR